MLFFVSTAIPATRQRLNTRINQRVTVEMQEEIADFEELMVESLLEPSFESNTTNSDQEALKKAKIYKVFDDFLSKRITEDDNFLITIADGQFYKSSSRSLPTVIDMNSSLMEQWQNLTQETIAEVQVAEPEIGSIIYKAIPIKTSSETLGVFIVAHATAGERKEAVEALGVIIEVLIIILAIALLIAWFATGRILTPLRRLAKTVKSINESELSQRIEVKGKGELAELGRTFNQMMDRLESSFATQREFINDAGHELRTPITIIRGHLEVMDDDPQEKQKTIDLVIDELDRMNRLVEDLVLLAKAERPDFLQPETIDLDSFSTELFHKIQALGQRNWRLDKIGAGQIFGDRQRLTQAIINLANNAVQHTAVNNLIVLGFNLKPNKIEFWITDTGEGIPVSDQNHIFERFARVKNTRRRSAGSGLGLSIVKAIVEAHGGHIHLQSRLGVGSTFTLIFPLEFKQKLVHDEANFNRRG
ncbi:MAG: ATP-binding protein [Waterburya sp.]